MRAILLTVLILFLISGGAAWALTVPSEAPPVEEPESVQAGGMDSEALLIGILIGILIIIII